MRRSPTQQEAPRHAGPHPSGDDSCPGALDPPSPPEDLLRKEGRRRRVWHALHRLRVYERELLVLRYLEDLTYDEIASILNVSRRTVERHLPRAEARFRHAYERCYTHAEPHDTPPWTPQRTRALFRLFQTSAPPDFQRQVLARLAQRQPAPEQRRRGWRALLAWGPGSRAWRRGTPQRHRRWPGYALAMLGCCGLVLGTSLAWWAARLVQRATHASAAAVAGRLPASALGRAHRGASPWRRPQRVRERCAPEETEQAAGPPTSRTSAPQMPMGQSVDKRSAFQAGDDPARTLLVPAPGSQLTAQKERQLPVHRYSQRSGRPRGAPGRPHARTPGEGRVSRRQADGMRCHARPEENPMHAQHPSRCDAGHVPSAPSVRSSLSAW